MYPWEGMGGGGGSPEWAGLGWSCFGGCFGGVLGGFTVCGIHCSIIIVVGASIAYCTAVMSLVQNIVLLLDLYAWRRTSSPQPLA